MWKVRPGFATYVAFSLACLVPGWLLRDIGAAEAQLRLSRLPFGPRDWRDVGRTGNEYLLRVMRDGATPARRTRAGDLLLESHDALVRARVRAMRGLGFTEQGGIFRALVEKMRGRSLAVTREEWGVAVDGLSDTDLVRALKAACAGGQHSPFLRDLWDVRAVTSERMLTRVLQTTDDVAIAQLLCEREWVQTGLG